MAFNPTVLSDALRGAIDNNAAGSWQEKRQAVVDSVDAKTLNEFLAWFDTSADMTGDNEMISDLKGGESDESSTQPE